ncbi:hypothetical protein [Peribacillus acanthi]|uniref:hypothetical protein n=1 Tax=Peribacillus acanthi TaxID=2171554 RepID=UPI000D3EA6A1|nr:hypothetical protein [Peribacillus acanthi]
MEISLCSVNCALPIEITIDEDNGRYMIRKSDTSGEYFNTATELISWIRQNMKEEEFCTKEDYLFLLIKLSQYEAGQF